MYKFFNIILMLVIFFGSPAMTINCCAPMEPFVNNIAACRKKSMQSEYTCAVAKCVVSERYGLTDAKGNIVQSKCVALLNKLDKADNRTIGMNNLIREKCLDNKYKAFITTDASCDWLKYNVCAYVCYLLKCVGFFTKPAYCAELAKNVKICNVPVMDQYVREKTLKC